MNAGALAVDSKEHPRSATAILSRVAACLGVDPRGASAELHRMGLWDRAACLACETGVGAVLHERALQGGIDPPHSSLTILAGYREHLRCANRYQAEHIAPVLAALERARIEFRVLKGAALNAWLYGRDDLRGMSDVDVMIHLVDADRAGRVLRRLGCRIEADPLSDSYFPRFYYEQPYLTGDVPPVRLDLHVRPFRPVLYRGTVSPDAFWSKPNHVSIGGVAVAIPRVEDMLIHLSVHAAIHGAERLIWLYDLMRVLQVFGERMDLAEVVRRAEAWRLAHPLRVALDRTRTLFGGGWAGADPEASRVCGAARAGRAIDRRLRARDDARGGASGRMRSGESDDARVGVSDDRRMGMSGEVWLRVLDDLLSRLPDRAGVLDRLVLWQSPRDADHAIAHSVVNVVSLSGVRDRLAYVRAVMWPGRGHLASAYPYRHRGWRLVAGGVRLARGLLRWKVSG